MAKQAPRSKRTRAKRTRARKPVSKVDSRQIATDSHFVPEKAILPGSLTVKSGVEPTVQTVLYVHGIGNKPVASVLKCQWDEALFGVQMADRTRMAYWVNRQYYPEPSD